MKHRIVYHDSIVRVEHRTRVVSSRKLPDGTIDTETESTGWWAIMGSGIAIRLPSEPVGLNVPAPASHTLEFATTEKGEDQ
jgi:hypothetical protein